MKKLLTGVIAVLVIGAVTVTGTQPSADQLNLELIPWPNKITTGDGTVNLSKGVSLSCGNPLLTQHVTRMLAGEYGITVNPASDVTISLELTDALADKVGEEGYTLVSGRTHIAIQAATPAGLFYGIQTLRQLIRSDRTMPVVRVEDQPAFSWRAFMLDEGRYFKGQEVVFSLLDEMSRLKMNTFHWHLTDDAGWRIEIDKYPLLTEVGAWRDSSEVGTWRSGRYDGKPHGGFYTKDQIREVIAYAADRFITIVPEIEMPGHACAAIAAYPWLGANGDTIRVPKDFAHNLWVLDVAEPKVHEFFQDVLTEVRDLFPGEVIHIGGDEVKYDHWKESPKIQALMAEKGFENLSEVQVDFTNQMSNYVESLGRRMMGWNEILGRNIHEWSQESDATGSAKLSNNAVIHFWKGDAANMREAIDRGHLVVNSTHNYTYLDYSYTTLPLETAYSFNPIPSGITGEGAALVLGLGCQMWCEWAPTVEVIHRQIFPRIAAYAETGWTSADRKDYNRFLRNLPSLETEWRAKGILPGEYQP